MITVVQTLLLVDPRDGFPYIQNGGPGLHARVISKILFGYVLSSSQITKAKNESLPEELPALT